MHAVENERLELQSWYDCSKDVGISRPTLTFEDIRSDPPIVTKNSGQIIHKTITYVPVDQDEQELQEITTDFHQFYYVKILQKWMTFLFVKNINECEEHDGTNRLPSGNETIIDGPLCPLKANQPTHIFSIHPPLNTFTPYGMYRSRQVYHNAAGQKIGCADMQFEYKPKRSTEAM